MTTDKFAVGLCKIKVKVVYDILGMRGKEHYKRHNLLVPFFSVYNITVHVGYFCCFNFCPSLESVAWDLENKEENITLFMLGLIH